MITALSFRMVYRAKSVIYKHLRSQDYRGFGFSSINHMTRHEYHGYHRGILTSTCTLTVPVSWGLAP
jgi:ribose 5-phosphate isomerase RpiB